jgi:hypothetical protein
LPAIGLTLTSRLRQRERRFSSHFFDGDMVMLLIDDAVFRHSAEADDALLDQGELDMSERR